MIDLIEFVVREARLIDQQRFEEWLDLFADDGHYWMPLEWEQSDPRLTTSLMYEDKLLLQIRIERLKGIARSRRSPEVDATTCCRSRTSRSAMNLETNTLHGRRCITWKAGSMNRIFMQPGPLTR